MAIDHSTAVTMTAACELGTHRCKGVVLSLTDAHGQPCACTCHGSPDNARHGHPSSPQDLAAAALHAVEAGIVEPPSTITHLMDQARATYEPMDAA